MSALSLVILFMGNITITSYRSVPGQTDATPYYTSTGERVSKGGAAVSQDLLCKACRRLHHRCAHPEVNGKMHYGDCLYIDGIGFKVVNDCMGKFKHYKVKTRHGLKSRFIKQNNWLDIWVPAYKDEHNFHKTNGIKQFKVYLVKEKYEAR